MVGGLLSLLVLPTASAEESRARQNTTRRSRAKSVAPSVVAPAQLEPPPLPPGLTLHEGAVQLQTTFEMSLSADSMVAPASIAPDIGVGVTDDLTISYVHSGAALTGFRGGAGAGFCFTGPDDGKCRTSYAGGGLEALYGLTRGNAAIAANGGVLLSAINPTHLDLKLGLKTKLALGAWSITFTPSIWYALNDRDDQDVPHEDQLFLPVGVWNKVTPQLSLGVGSGMRAPLRRLGKRYVVPVGVAAQVALNPRVGIGASLVFGRVVGGNEVMNPDPGVDARVLQIWLSVASR